MPYLVQRFPQEKAHFTYNRTNERWRKSSTEESLMLDTNLHRLVTAKIPAVLRL